MLRAPFLALLLLVPVMGCAQTDPKPLVGRMVQNELQAAKDDHSHWMYVDTVTEAGVTKTSDVVETSAGTLELLVAENGQPLSAQDRANEIEKLREKAQDTRELKKERQATEDDSKKATEMLRMLPDAFIYTLVDESGELIHLHFVPNSSFDPPTREAKVFHAMAGDMYIDKKAERLAAMRGTLTANVYFGWGGILGKLFQGGTFHLEQKEVGPGHWEISLLDVNMIGRALLFKSINEQQHEKRFQYRSVPRGTTPEQAVALLLNGFERNSYSAQK